LYVLDKCYSVHKKKNVTKIILSCIYVTSEFQLNNEEITGSKDEDFVGCYFPNLCVN